MIFDRSKFFRIRSFGRRGCIACAAGPLIGAGREPLVPGTLLSAQAVLKPEPIANARSHVREPFAESPNSGSFTSNLSISER